MSDDKALGLTAICLSRGAHQSRGESNSGDCSRSSSRTSWTGEAEVMDYISFVGAFMEYLRLKAQTRGVDDPSKIKYDVVLAGYSYGALMTMRLPPVLDILQRFDDAAMGSVELRIMDEAITFVYSYVNVKEPVLTHVNLLLVFAN